MFKWLNNKSGSSRAGQVAIVFVVVAAIAIILYAVTLNLGKVAQNKTQTIVAANTSASLLASQMASYAESLFQTSLGGEEGTGNDLTVSGWTGVAAAILTLIAVVVAIILIIFSEGALTNEAIALIVAVAALAVGAVVVQVAIVQPGITDLWNKLSENLDIADQFSERGLRTGLQAVVGDQELVADELDIDLDGIFGAQDRVSRFSVYYTERLKQQNLSRADAIKDFLNALEKFIYGYSKYDEPPFDPDGQPRAWSLWDPLCDVYTDHPCCLDPEPGVNIPSECNPCCLPETVNDPRSGLPADYPVRPDCCDAADDTYCGTASTCGTYSLYGENYPWVYNAYYEDYTNNCIEMDRINPDTGQRQGCRGRPPSPQFLRHRSFKELLGRDDEHGNFKAVVAHHYEYDSGFAIAQAPGSGFYADDTKSLGIVYRDRNDNEFLTHGTLYDFLWAMGDIEADLAKVDPGNVAANDFYNTGAQCYWCDGRMTEAVPGASQCDADPGCVDPLYGGPSNCCVCNSDIAGLQLPDDCRGEVEDREGNLIPYPGGCSFCVDMNTDAVGNLRDVFTDFDACAVGPVIEGMWKKGADRFCSSEWPYESGCPKHGRCLELGENGLPDGERDCVCGENGSNVLPAELWQDDMLDEMVYGINEFIGWAYELLSYDRSVAVQTFSAWVESARSWIAPADSFSPEPGELIRWRDFTSRVRFAISHWLDRDYSARESFPPPTCDQNAEGYVWCVPPAGCKGVSQKEEAFWGVAPGGPVTLDNVLNCLYYNTIEGGGNDQRFFDCSNTDPGPDPVNPLPTCSPETCADLPRSLLGDEFYDYVYSCDSRGENCQSTFDPGDPEDIEAFQSCLNSINHGTCSASTCGSLPSGYNVPDFEDGTDDFARCFNRCSTNNCQNLVGQGEPAVPPFNAPGSDYAALNQCAEGQCVPGGFVGDCRDPLLYPEFQGIPQDCAPDSAYLAAVRAERDAQAGSCLADSGFLQAVEANMGSGGGNSCSDPDFKAAVEDALCEAQGSCCDPTWLDLMHKSHVLARNQSAKFSQRYDYLLERQAQAERLYTGLGAATENFTNLLDGPAKDLLAAANFSEDEAPLPNKVIYGWRGDPPPGKDKGYWHFVRLDTRIPGRCEGQCGRNGGVEPAFPTIKTYTRHWGTKRYYSLGDSFGQPGCQVKSDYKKVDKCFKGGQVKARVVRFDQQREELAFPNNIPIWQFVFSNPAVENAASADVNFAGEFCSGAGIGNKAGPPGAFMLNGPETDSQCWTMINDILSRGVVSQTCAEYFYHKPPFSTEGNRRGFSLKFVNCTGAN